jgi:hypothetical protein
MLRRQTSGQTRSWTKVDSLPRPSSSKEAEMAETQLIRLSDAADKVDSLETMSSSKHQAKRAQSSSSAKTSNAAAKHHAASDANLPARPKKTKSRSGKSSPIVPACNQTAGCWLLAAGWRRSCVAHSLEARPRQAWCCVTCTFSGSGHACGSLLRTISRPQRWTNQPAVAGSWSMYRQWAAPQQQ